MFQDKTFSSDAQTKKSLNNTTTYNSLSLYTYFEIKKIFDSNMRISFLKEASKSELITLSPSQLSTLSLSTLILFSQLLTLKSLPLNSQVSLPLNSRVSLPLNSQLSPSQFSFDS